MSRSIQQYKKELENLAEGLPYKKIELPEFKRKSFHPVRVRQPRNYIHAERGMQAIGRFLIERGVVEILKGPQILELFREIHWCAGQMRKLARKRFKSAREAREAVVEARRYVSEIEAAEEELFIANRRLVVSCVKPFFWIGQVWIADFLQEGAKALTNAIRKFDFTRGTPFYAYAQKAIQNRLRNYFRDHVRSGSIGIRPTNEMVAIKKAVDDWKEENGEEPDVAAIAGLTGLSEERIVKVRPFIHQWENMPSPPVSLDALVGDTETSLYNFVEDAEAEKASAAAQRSEIWEAIDRLPARAKYIMRLRFIEGRTLEETGQALSLTRARIKQIQDDSLRKLRQMLRRGVKHPNM